jgi:hypothetical protein
MERQPSSEVMAELKRSLEAHKNRPDSHPGSQKGMDPGIGCHAMVESNDRNNATRGLVRADAGGPTGRRSPL